MSGNRENMMKRSIMAVSIKQPWAEFIISGLMPVGNFGWKINFTGVVVIKAAKELDNDWKYAKNFITTKGSEYLNKKIIATKGMFKLERNVFIGAVILAQIDTVYDSDWCITGKFFHRYIHPLRFKHKIKAKMTQKFSLPPKGFQNKLGPQDSKPYRNLQSLSKSLGYKSEIIFV